MKWRFLKYLMAYSVPAMVLLSFQLKGIGAYAPLIYAFALVPLLELLFKPNPRNLDLQSEEMLKDDPWYDFLLRLMVAVQIIILALFLFDLKSNYYDVATLIGRVSSMGIMCGVIGINVGHELGHRRLKFDQFLAKILLSTSLYVHFFTEHNYGHHKNVATPEDPATARYGESLYRFWLRSIIFSYISAWKIQAQLIKSRKASFWSIKNDLLLWHLIQFLALAFIGFFFTWKILIAFCAAALFGMLLLETVNYIEHYGLSRKKLSALRYEKAEAEHSWNSDHVVGRLLLFELSRHSDHHANPHRKYQILKHHEESPQLPTGYPGMMLLSAIPPLWFKVMNSKLIFRS